MGPHYRPRMKDLRRRAFAMQQSWGTHLPLGPPCSATSVAGILVTAAQALTEAHKERPRERKPMNPPVNAPAIKIVKSVREQVSAEEWQSRVDPPAPHRPTPLYGTRQMT